MRINGSRKRLPLMTRLIHRAMDRPIALAIHTLVSATVLMAAAPAVAECVPTTAPPLSNGGTITCTDSVNSTLTLAPPGITSLTVNVNGASFNVSPSIQGDSMDALTLNNNGGSIQAVNLTLITALTFQNSGNFNGPFTASNIGTMSFVNSGNMQATTLTDIVNLTVQNSGNMNSGLIVSGDGNHFIQNDASGHINLTLQTSNGNDTINNFGQINSGINPPGQINNGGSGSLTIHNFAGATINAGIQHTGSGVTTITNDDGATIQGGSILLGSGNDLIVNRGTINSNIDQGNGDNQFVMLSGTVNASITQGSGNDSTQINGGTINGTLNAGGGNDSLIWNAGLINGINMGPGNDSAQFNNLTQTELRTIPIDGGLGNDQLFWSNTQGETAGRLLNWELIQLAQFSQLTMSQNDNLILGDTGALTGALSIDATSTLFAGNGSHSILPAVAGNLVNVVNAGTIDLTNGPRAATDALTIVGNYQGQNGSLRLDTALGSDGSQSDRLIMSGAGATTTGSTGISISNLNGPGALTLQNGILVVQATNGATTGAGTFSLAGRAAAGAYEYMLFRSGITADPATDNNWYLRTFIPSGICAVAGVAVDCGTAVAPPPPTGPNPPPTTEPPPPGGGGATPPGGGVILYRPEVPLDSVVPALARMGVTTMLGTFHEREGEQVYASADGVLHKGWARTFGGFFDRSWYGSVLPSTNGGTFGFQTGMPVVGWDHNDGQKDRIGVFVGYGKTLADVSGYALGRLNLPAGHVSIDTPSVGAYWTHFNAIGGYIDGVLMGSFINQFTRSNFGTSQNNSGSIVTASIEVGQPIPITANWAIEPQAQFIAQRQQFDQAVDGFSTISFGNDTVYTGRLGARLVGDMFYNATRVRPYLLANVWHEFKGTDLVSFGDTLIFNNRGSTSLELGVGGSAAISQNIDLFGRVSHTLSIDAGDQRFTAGKIGVQMRF